MALYAGAASAAVAAGGTAAYLKRDTLTEGYSWVGSHLEFVGCLVRAEELRRRVTRIVELERAGVLGGWAVIYTVLGKGAVKGKAGVGEGVGMMVGDGKAGMRTFCSLPREGSEVRGYFEGSVNEKARDEAGAHMSEFLSSSSKFLLIV